MVFMVLDKSASNAVRLCRVDLARRCLAFNKASYLQISIERNYRHTRLSAVIVRPIHTRVCLQAERTPQCPEKPTHGENY